MLRQNHNPTPITPQNQYKLDDGQTSISNYFPARPLKRAISTDNFWQTRVITTDELNFSNQREGGAISHSGNFAGQEIAAVAPVGEHHGVGSYLNGIQKSISINQNNLTTTPDQSPRDDRGERDFQGASSKTFNARYIKHAQGGHGAHGGHGTYGTHGHPHGPHHDPDCDPTPWILDDKFILKITSAGTHENVISLNISGIKFKQVQKRNFDRLKSCAFVQASRTDNSVNLDTFEDLESLSDLELNMSEITHLAVPEIKPDWCLSVLDLSYNKLNFNTSQNITILSHIPKLRVLNLSGNDLTNFGHLDCFDSSHSFTCLELLVAEDNRLTSKVFSEIKDLFPNVKVVVLNKNFINRIPSLTSSGQLEESNLENANINGRVVSGRLSTNLFDESNIIQEEEEPNTNAPQGATGPIPKDFKDALDNEIEKLDHEYKARKKRDKDEQQKQTSVPAERLLETTNTPLKTAGSSKIRQEAHVEEINDELRILSLIGNPIKKFEDFSNILQYKNLSILKLHETPFVKTTSKNPEFVDQSGIVVERHAIKRQVGSVKGSGGNGAGSFNELGARTRSAKSKLQDSSSSSRKSKNNFRKIPEPIRFKRDKRWFEDLINDLEKRVKYEVRAAILGEPEGASSSSEIRQERQEAQNQKSNQKNKLSDKPADNPIFMTEVEAGPGGVCEQAETASIADSASTITINGIRSDISEISDTITDMSALDGSLYSRADAKNGNNQISRVNLRTPTMPMSDNVSRLRMMLNKKNMVQETFKQDHQGIKTFLYKPEDHPKPNTAKALKVQNRVENDMKTEDVVGRTLDKLKIDSVVNEEGLSVESEKLDGERFEVLKREYWKLREEINKE